MRKLKKSGLLIGAAILTAAGAVMLPSVIAESMDAFLIGTAYQETAEEPALPAAKQLTYAQKLQMLLEHEESKVLYEEGKVFYEEIIRGNETDTGTVMYQKSNVNALLLEQGRDLTQTEASAIITDEIEKLIQLGIFPDAAFLESPYTPTPYFFIDTVDGARSFIGWVLYLEADSASGSMRAEAYLDESTGLLFGYTLFMRIDESYQLPGLDEAAQRWGQYTNLKLAEQLSYDSGEESREFSAQYDDLDTEKEKMEEHTNVIASYEQDGVTVALPIYINPKRIRFGAVF